MAGSAKEALDREDGNRRGDRSHRNAEQLGWNCCRHRSQHRR